MVECSGKSKRVSLTAGIAHLHGVQRTARRDEQGFAVCTAEQNLRRTLRHFDGTNPFAGVAVNENLAGGDIDVAFDIFGNTFAANFGKQFYISETAVITDRGAIGILLVFIGDVEPAVRRRRRQSEGKQHIVDLGTVIEGAGDKIFSGVCQYPSIYRTLLLSI